MQQQNRSSVRLWLVCWMYAVAAGHLVVGVLLTWLGNADLFDGYHRSVEQSFWAGAAPAAARGQSVWWIALFGATVQNLALWMLALVHIGNRQRYAAAWAWLLAGLALWAPQDMWLSMQAQAWTHVWVDLFALLVMVPPLVWLWRLDRS